MTEKKEQKEKGRFLRAVDWISDHLALLALTVSILFALLAWIFLDASILYPIQEIAYKQEESRYNAQQLESKKEIVKGLLSLGSEFLDVGNYVAARKEFKEVLKLDENSMEATLGLFKADIFEQIDGEYDPEVVEKRIRFILDKNKDDPHAFVFLGEIYYAMGKDRYKEAKENYLKAIEAGNKKNPPSPPASAYAGLGLIYNGLDELKAAISNLEKAVELSKWNQRFLNNLAYLYSETDQYQKAIDKYSLVLQLDSSYLLPFYQTASLYRLKGDIESSIDLYKELIKRLGDEKIASLPKNSGSWSFGHGKDIFYIDTLPEKKFYAYYGISLTFYLNDQMNGAKTMAKRAIALNIPKQNRILALVDYDLDRLKKANPNLAGRLDDFRRDFE